MKATMCMLVSLVLAHAAWSADQDIPGEDLGTHSVSIESFKWAQGRTKGTRDKVFGEFSVKWESRSRFTAAPPSRSYTFYVLLRTRTGFTAAKTQGVVDPKKVVPVDEFDFDRKVKPFTLCECVERPSLSIAECAPKSKAVAARLEVESKRGRPLAVMSPDPKKVKSLPRDKRRWWQVESIEVPSRRRRFGGRRR